MRVIAFEAEALEHLAFWQKHNKKILAKILGLLESIQQTPFAGIGKPEPLKGWLLE